jgi:uncharacterized protein (TIGR03067 family)
LLGTVRDLPYNLAALVRPTFLLEVIMTKLLAPLALLACVAAVSADDKAATPAKASFDAAKLVGDWVYVSGVKGGEKVEKDRLEGKVVFTKDRITIPAGGDMKFVMAYKLDTKTNPVNIDIEIKEGPVNEGKAKGIIAFDGDQLKLCYHPTGGERPKKFESTKENGNFYFVLKPAKK